MRVPVIDYAPTRVFRQARRARTPACPVVVVRAPAAAPTGTRSGVLAHPRLVQRARPGTPAPTAPADRDRAGGPEPTDPRR